MLNHQIEYIPNILALQNIPNSNQVDCLSYIDDKFDDQAPEVRQNVMSLIE